MIEDKIEQTIKINHLIEKGDKVIVGVSGGPDSMCLLHFLNKLKRKLQFTVLVCHINHMIRKEADEETEYVMEYCKKNEIECFVKKIDVLRRSI